MPSDAPIDGGTDAARVDAGPPLTAEEGFLRALDAALCDMSLACGTDDDAPHETACHPRLGSRWTQRVRRNLRVLSFAPDAAARCLAAVRAAVTACPVLDWTTFESPFARCSQAFTGLGAAGSECTPGGGDAPSLCAPGLACIGTTCRATAAAREPCDDTVWCGVFAERPLACVDGLCSALPAAGEPCLDVDRCDLDAICVDGMCVAMPGRGEPCVPSLARTCVTGLACLDGICGTPRAQGEPCPNGSECDATLWCGEASVCTAVNGGVGTLCASFAGRLSGTCIAPAVCRVDLRSWYTFGACVDGAVAGATCDASQPCARGARCVDGTCRPLAGPGQACAADRACPDAFACVDGACAPLPVAGESCAAEGRCASARCVDGTCCLVADGGSCDPHAAPAAAPCDGECSGVCGRTNDCDARCGPDRGCTGAGTCAPLCGRGG